jgi:hypothetical protein
MNKKDKIQKECLICKKVFFVHPYREFTAKLCSKNCQIKYNALRRTGKHKSNDTKEKIRKANKGKKRSLETKTKLSESHKGIHYLERPFKIGHIPWNKGLKGYMAKEKNPNWKGGISDKNSKIRGSIEYKHWRLQIFKRDWFSCQICGHKGKDIEAHHIKNVKNYPELIFDMNNGITLCDKCHLLTRKKEESLENIFIKLLSLKE